MCGRKRQTGGSHENRADNQHPPTSDPVCPGRQEEGYHHITRKREGEHQAALPLP